MQNIFSEEDYNGIVKRVENLQATQISQWGLMDVLQMLQHCSLQLKLASGKNSAQEEGTALYRTTIVKWFALYVMPWSKGLPTPAIMNMHNNSV